MKNLLLTLALAVSAFASAQTMSLTIVNDTYTDMAFFDVFTIDANTGDVKRVGKHIQAFDGVICFTRLEVSDNVELVIQKRTHPERQLLDEFSARIHCGDTNTLSVIDPSELFQVIKGMDYSNAITAGCNQPNH